MSPKLAEHRELQASPAVVRVGDTVRRPSSGAAVHALLAYLEQAGFGYSPRLLGVDEHGREVLSYLPGSSGRHGWAQVVPVAGLRAFAQLLRAYHDAVADFAPTVHAWALEARPPLPGEIVCHGDFGPWNLVWQGGRPVGLLDFDFARPAPALTDVAYALEYSVPFRADQECLRWLAYPSPPDRGARLEAFAEAYGLSETAGLVDQVIAGQRDRIEQVGRLAAAGRQPQADWVANGYLQELARRVGVSERLARGLG